MGGEKEEKEMKIDQTSKKRFAANIRKDNATGCWLWEGAKTRGGYGNFTVNGKSVRAHRWIWELINGPVPKGFDVHHVCGNRACMNPRHLRAVAHGENMREAARRGVFSGERNGRSKLREAQVHFIRILYDLGVKPNQIAERYPIKKRNVAYIATRQTWKHIDFPEILSQEEKRSFKETVEMGFIALQGAVNRYRENGWPVKKKYLDTLSLCARFLG